MIQPKTIILCADDFGLDSGVSEGILKLAHMGRLSAVSCMVNSPGFIAYAQELYSLKNQVKIGLHFNLTEGYFLSEANKSCFTLNQLLIQTHLRSVKLSFIANEFLAQLDQFMQAMQQAPDFIDGHQHVHQFPGIRQVILDLYEQRLKDKGISIRSTWPSINLPQYQWKAKVLGLTGGKVLHGELIKWAIPHNHYFSGIYDFKTAISYQDIFKKWLNLAKENTLIMCHPGGSKSTDAIAPARLIEFNYFLSDEFLMDCNTYDVHLTTCPKPRHCKAVN